MAAYFVTATGTDIGKTFVTAGLVHAMKRRGLTVSALKPVLSGFDPGATDSDAHVLMDALGTSPAQIHRVAPWRFRAPLSPDMAAAREGRTIDTDALVDFCREAIELRTNLFIEGVGGVMVPLAAEYTVLDWMEALQLPLILVAGSYLGTISHTLTALDAVTRRGLTVAAVVINESESSPPPLAETAASIRRFAKDVPVATLARNADDAAFDALLDFCRRPA